MNTWLDADRALLESFRNRFGRLFSDFATDTGPLFSGVGGLPGERIFPPLNLWEDGEHLFAECELPGVRMDDLDVSVLGRDLTIRGKREPRSADEATVHRCERDSGAFRRVLHLPSDVDAEKVHADLRHGVLTITLPKAPEARPRKIEVQTTAK